MDDGGAGLLLVGCTVDLGSLGGDYAAATAMNETGVVVGVARTASGAQHGSESMADGLLVYLTAAPTSPQPTASTTAASWWAKHSGAASGRRVQWAPDGTEEPLDLGPGSDASDINEAGTVVGTWRGGPAGVDAYVRDAAGHTSRCPMSPAPSSSSRPTGSTTPVTWWAPPTSTANVAVLWEAPDYQPVVLGAGRPSDVIVEAYDVNDAGDVVGQWRAPRLQSGALLWRAGTHDEVELPVASGDEGSYAAAINYNWSSHGVGAPRRRRPRAGPCAGTQPPGHPSSWATSAAAAQPPLTSPAPATPSGPPPPRLRARAARRCTTPARFTVDAERPSD